MARARLRPVAHDDRLPLTEHLEELRGRVLVSLAAIGAALALCFWQNRLILALANRPLEGVDSVPAGFKPITLAPAEGFMTTFTLATYGAILLALPVILYQVYAFVLPAFTPRERRAALPLLLLIPVLFIGGALFCYFIVLEPALDFLLGFNAAEFTTELRARDYYGFVAMLTVAMGLLFQVPIGVLAVTRLGLVTPAQLRRNRRYAILVLAIVAALLPTIDPITMLLELVPLVLLYELSIWLASAFGARREELAERPASETG